MKEPQEVKEKQLTTQVKPLQMASIKDMKKWYNDFVAFTKGILKKELDYGTIPGVEKPSLFKPGAEKLRFVYKLQTKTEQIDKTIDLTTGYVDYTYKTTVLNPDGSANLADCEGSANSFEDRYLYKLVRSDKKPNKEEGDKLKAEGKGKWRKFGNEWVWYDRVRSNPESLIGLKNTIQKMAQKRSFVGAILIATGASEFFTQDVEDMEISNSEAKKTTTTTKEPKVEKGEKTKVQEGEVVQDEPISTGSPVRDAKIKWVKALIEQGKVSVDKQPEEMTDAELAKAMTEYKESIGK